jgi:hypothetical protein
MYYIEMPENISTIDFRSSEEERLAEFKKNYKEMCNIIVDERSYFEDLLPAMCNIVSCICDDEDYVFDDTGILTEDCPAFSLFEKIDNGFHFYDTEEAKKEIKDYLLLKEKYEYLIGLDDER